MTRLLALDVGEVRIGVAVSDATGLLASPYTTLHVPRSEKQLWTALQQIVDETEAEGIVVGLPVSLDGAIHAQGERILAFAERLKAHISLPVSFWDERLSTVEAERLLLHRPSGAGRKPRRSGQSHSRKSRQRGHELDALAATVILQEYLDSLRSSKQEEKEL
ncbi:putative Holliday junction resolvase [Thermosporothrix hazakensis]|jgi:putative Holliday junction resolvase|uniref:Putative pre-16S rRNA nuclease n=2 Tax=Thermosporothrix TaxID=768650 RepID=A0A326UCU0_THEHA|nr:Holliday junction resolvase RuvX [Thermosporothrix hazakensis]PZW26642.1 putative Holliday junction resolvase [Thermosporothrix hazakensis]BBH89472.1 putative pre-16S rRNA nuclease [Thermosporothrix sp. COM3]GCE47656.1 putative pre-16S rRNA nuclease [Thermosporothrix hazakensis]